MRCKIFLFFSILFLLVITLNYSVNAIDISDCNQLQAMGLTGSYVLTQNIDCSGRNFQPIGSMTNPFTGTFNGNGKIITGLSETSNCGYPGCAMGLFGKIQDANVYNVGLKNVNIANTGSPSVYVGALTGIAIRSTVSGCFSTGSISIASGVPYTSEAGGLIGLIGTSSTVSNSYSQVNVNAGGGNWVGGFTGFSGQATITNCYSTGFVAHSKAWGGFVGYNGNGGYTSTYNHDYWDTQTSGTTTDGASNTGLTTSLMHQQSSYVGWDFTNVWRIKNGQDYPRLWWECTPQCAGKQCGPDTCGGNCPPGCSGSTLVCNSGQCVQCIDKSQCGTDQFIGNTFCKSGDVSNIYRNKTIYSCLSFICGSSISEQIFQTCSTTQECLNGICVDNYVGSVNWTNMIDKLIKNADLNDRVKLMVSGAGLKGKDFNFNVYKAGGNLVFGSISVTGKDKNYVYATWRAGMKNDGTLSNGDYYYKVDGLGKNYDSRKYPGTNIDNPFGILTVSNLERNSRPVAKIENPKKGEIKNINIIIGFNQSSYDADDFLNYTWDLGDLTIIRGSTINYVNYNLTHGYSIDGQKNINLSVVDERGLTDQDLVSILITNPNAIGKKYVFAGIRKPKYDETLDQIGNVVFDASDSYAVQVAAGGVLNCLGGNCPGSVLDTIGNRNNYTMFNFSWRFDDGTSSGIISGSPIYSKALSIGNHITALEVSLGTGEKANTIVIFNYQGGGSEKCQNNKTEWVDAGIVYSTLEANGKCKGDLASTDDDCCPTSYTCQGSDTNAQCVINSTCIPVKYSCGEYKDSINCTNDKINNCNVADKSCTSSPSNINICGEQTSGGAVGGGCNCFWNGTNCKLNKTTSINIGTIALGGTCVVDTISAGECNEGQMIVTQNSAMKWDDIDVLIGNVSGVTNHDEADRWVNVNCNLDELCFSGTRPMVCEDDGIRLGFFSLINFFIAIIIIAIVYFILFRIKKVKLKRK